MAKLNYQYGTSPRKEDPYYDIPVKKVTKQIQKRTVVKKTKPRKQNKEFVNKGKTILYITVAFLALFAISYRNSEINEKFKEVKNLNDKLAVVQKENDQLEIAIESNLNLTNIEQSAKELLGMQKLEGNQKKYINLPKVDYVESSIEEVIKEENTNLLEKIYNFIVRK